jgi:hypothetical protein
MKDEGRRMKDEGRRMKDEGRRMKDEGRHPQYGSQNQVILPPSSFILLLIGQPINHESGV